METKQTLTLIAAIGSNNALGKDNDLIWHLPADLQHFKNSTSGHHIIMGRNTFESIGKALPNRTNVIITRNPNYSVENCIIVNTLEDAIKIAENDNNPFIVGGAQIYNQAINLVDKLIITEVHKDFEADTFFPKIDKSIWKEVNRQNFKADEKNKYDYSFVTYLKN
ncbi:diacylglycerol kinase [Urechidicola croceus]|uniref:Dihydrofolate reductase n=1 Tax=Urechidicola croceus TaxID=1850246 RepID=A0A1D8PBY1_9FLAO|nr:diacylglycerol kinase [Urechidicola croceus]